MKNSPCALMAFGKNWCRMMLLISMVTSWGCRQTQFHAAHLFRATTRPIVASPLAVDFDRDGRLEIAVGSLDGHFYLLDDSLCDFRQFSLDNSLEKGRQFYSSPAAWDIDRDGFPEIFVASENGKLWGWKIHDVETTRSDVPRRVAGFPIALDGIIRSSPTIVADSLIAIGGSGKMFVFDRQGRAAPGWPQEINGLAEATAAWFDDVLAISTLVPGESSRGYLHAWRLNGTSYPNFPINLKMDSNSSPTLVDLDGDDRIEIVIGDDAGFLHVFRLDGSELPGFPRLAGDRLESSPTVSDIDGNGMFDIIIGSADGRIYAWNAVGDALLGWPVKTSDEVYASIAIADIDGDGRLEVVAGSRDYRLYAFYAEGTPVPGFPINCGDKILSSPWVGDLDGDGQTDIVVGADNGIHRIPNLGKLGACPWPMFRHDLAHTGAVVTPSNKNTPASQAQ
ncbi:MAG: VCBS repeat-containing protein [candidate division KSB1 bacterium]|nr:VCBS repeat-containing protein [candidate division KSB1 bacterium]MDZ7302849.1 VCBS repeat-containing protein [candidate division KSB1 bacterium]MDZ7311866.1 VCBS repeat-containing protein [candidate division KSB1 bacterium]